MTHAPRTANSRIADVEDMLDRFYVSGYKKGFSVYEYMRTTDCTYGHAMQVAAYYRPLAAEAEELRDGESQLREGHRGLTKAQLNKLVEQVQSIVADAERFASNLKASKPRKPRLRKEKSVEQLTKGFAYMGEHMDLKLISAPPAQIVGASTVYLYNVKYKTLQALVAKEKTGLTVRGSTVFGWDEQASCTKTIRKPEEFFKTFLGTGWKSAIEMVGGLKTKPQTPTGRSNRDTVIVRVVKNNG